MSRANGHDRVVEELYTTGDVSGRMSRAHQRPTTAAGRARRALADEHVITVPRNASGMRLVLYEDEPVIVD